MNSLNIILTSSLIATLVSILINEWFSRGREQRQNKNRQFNNLYSYYYEQYLSDDVKNSRNSLLDKEYKKTQEDMGHAGVLSRGLQRVAIMIYTGNLPLEYPFILNGAQIVQDWNVLSSSLRVEESLNEIPIHWRHAEWLAILAWMNMVNQQQTIKIDDSYSQIIKNFYKLFGSQFKNIIAREKLLFKIDKDNAGKQVIKARKKIIKKFKKTVKKNLIGLNELE